MYASGTNAALLYIKFDVVHDKGADLHNVYCGTTSITWFF